MTRGKHSASVNNRLREQLHDLEQAVRRETQRAEEAEQRAEKLERRVADLLADSDLDAERQRHAAIEARLNEDIRATHDYYRKLLDDAKPTVKTHFRLVGLLPATERDMALYSAKSSAAMNKLWPEWQSWDTSNSREMRRAVQHRMKEAAALAIEEGTTTPL